MWEDLCISSLQRYGGECLTFSVNPPMRARIRANTKDNIQDWDVTVKNGRSMVDRKERVRGERHIVLSNSICRKIVTDIKRPFSYDRISFEIFLPPFITDYIQLSNFICTFRV